MTINQLMVLKFEEDVQAKYIKYKGEAGNIVVTRNLISKICINNEMSDVIAMVLNHVKSTEPTHCKKSSYEWIVLRDFAVEAELKMEIFEGINPVRANEIAGFVKHLVSFIVEVREMTDVNSKKFEVTEELFMKLIRESASKDQQATKTYINDFLTKDNKDTILKMGTLEYIFTTYSKADIKAFYRTLKAVIN